MNNNRYIPDKFYDKVNAMPEYSYGVTHTRVILDDGLQFSDVFIAWGSEVVRVGVSEEIPFDTSRIVAVERH